MSDLFEHAFLERQQAVYPYLDVRVYAAAVTEMHQRTPVRNPNGLLVHWLKGAANRVRPGIASADAMTRAELERYAELWVELLKRTATMGLTPRQIATCLQHARENGYPKLNRCIEAQLCAQGLDWPEHDARRSHVSRNASSGRMEAS